LTNKHALLMRDVDTKLAQCRDASSAACATVRILRIIDRMNIGGPAKHVTWLSAGLDASTYETMLVTGVVSEHEGDMTGFARAAGVEPLVIHELGRELGWRDVVVIYKLFVLMWRVRPDIVHTHKAKAGAVGRIAAFLYRWLTPSALWLRPRRCLVLHTFHGHIFHSYYGALKTKLFVLIERMLARFATDSIIVISQQQRREINEQFGVGRTGQFRVIPLGLDFGESRTARSLREEYGIDAGTFIVAIVGRLCAVKNQTMFLDAASALIRQGQPIHFFVIGDGELRDELATRVEQLDISACVTFTGFRKDVSALYAQCDLVALTSLNEGTPLTLIEAFHAGCPAVSTAVGGVTDLMGEQIEQRDGFTLWEHGATVVSRDEKSLAEAILYLLERPELRHSMAGRAGAFVKAHYSRARLLSDIQGLYTELWQPPTN
jgi:glycosyltransferase involved in cell wall biosynthesis